MLFIQEMYPDDETAECMYEDMIGFTERITDVALDGEIEVAREAYASLKDLAQVFEVYTGDKVRILMEDDETKPNCYGYPNTFINDVLICGL